MLHGNTELELNLIANQLLMLDGDMIENVNIYMNGEPIEIVDMGMGGHDPNYYEQEGHAHHHEGILEGPPAGGYDDKELKKHHHEQSGKNTKERMHAISVAIADYDEHLAHLHDENEEMVEAYHKEHHNLESRFNELKEDINREMIPRYEAAEAHYE